MANEILVCTPCYGDLVKRPHFESCLALRKEFMNAGVDHDWQTLGNESLITRARNVLASGFLYDSVYQCLFFFDADIECSPADVAKLWNLCYAGADVAVGPYRMKKPNAPLAAWVDGRLLNLEDLENKEEPFKVDYAGTGFMMIRRKTFENLIMEDKVIDYAEGQCGPDGKEGRCWNFFMDGIEGDMDGDWQARHHLPEDYWFCKRVQEAGMSVMMDPSIKLLHHGNAAY